MQNDEVEVEWNDGKRYYASFNSYGVAVITRPVESDRVDLSTPLTG